MRLKKNAWKRGNKPAYKDKAAPVHYLDQRTRAIDARVDAGYCLFDCPRGIIPTFARPSLAA